MLEIRKDYVGAIPHFAMAISDVNENFDMYSHKEKSSPPDAYFHLATCYHLNEEIDKAETYYNMFKTESRGKSELLPVADLRLLQCAEARVQMASPVSVLLKNVGPQII